MGSGSGARDTSRRRSREPVRLLRQRPSERDISRFLREQAEAPLSYAPIGISRQSPSGYDVDEHRLVIGRGETAFERARAALDAWAMFRLGWVELHPAHAPTTPGTTVAILVRHLGFWSLHACRVVERLAASPEGPVHGFAYGTLSAHAERGEELFAIELDVADGSVWYRIRAVSRPHSVLARVGYPLARRLQRRFREDSGRAMRAAVAR